MSSNTGAAFSIFQGNNFFFVALAVVALVVVLFWLIRDQFNPNKEQRMGVVTKIALSLFVAGIGGNLLDRVLKGSVVDFLDFYFKHYSWPYFNVADSCICVAAALLVLMSFRRTKPTSLTGFRDPTNELGYGGGSFGYARSFCCGMISKMLGCLLLGQAVQGTRSVCSTANSLHASQIFKDL